MWDLEFNVILLDEDEALLHWAKLSPNVVPLDDTLGEMLRLESFSFILTNFSLPLQKKSCIEHP